MAEDIKFQFVFNTDFKIFEGSTSYMQLYTVQLD